MTTTERTDLTAVRELQIRAEILDKRVAAGEQTALVRLRALPQLKLAQPEALTEAATRIRRKHCLTIVAREVGFSSWEQARRVLDGDPDETDFGTMLYPNPGGALNAWFATYDEARVCLDSADGRRFLLAYKRHFFVVEPAFVEQLGLDPMDPDWEAIARDWVRPRELAARDRLYLRRIRATTAH